jgi:hypothetical protein
MNSLRICIHGSYFSLNASGNYLEPNAREQLPLGAKSIEDPDSAIHEHCSSKNPLYLGRKTLPFGIPTVRTGRSSLPMHPFGQ